MADFKGGRGKKAGYETQMYRIPTPLRPVVEAMGLQFRLLWDGLSDPQGEKLISRIQAAIPDSEQIGCSNGKNLISDNEDYQKQISSLQTQVKMLGADADRYHFELSKAKDEIDFLCIQLEDKDRKAVKWYDKVVEAEAELERLRTQPQSQPAVNPEVIALLQEALKLPANTGGKIKEKIKSALALI